MEARKAETAYLRRRVSDSLAMAASAAESCAQIAHLTLARLYGEAIDTPVVLPGRPSFHALFSEAATAERAFPSDRASFPQTVFMIRDLAEDEKQLSSALLS
ncbi:hypothetical protein [uncultured Sphingomonas sp.]|uniref:hypothetical protein n=1 Tax=uncultured Sphingomonas sp. TaxID=158754 RepID=UPI0035CB82F5